MPPSAPVSIIQPTRNLDVGSGILSCLNAGVIERLIGNGRATSADLRTALRHCPSLAGFGKCIGTALAINADVKRVCEIDLEKTD